MLHTSDGAEMEIEEVEEYTLSDDAWKDSFDKLLDPRPVLRELNLLKKDVRASFNMNSSVENCSRDSNKSIPTATPLRGKGKMLLKVGNSKNSRSISTPVLARQMVNPFKCSLSPIGAWKFRYFNNESDKKKHQLDAVVETFHATPINPDIVIVDYDEEKVDSHSSSVEELLLVPNKKSQDVNRDRRRVCFDVSTHVERTKKRTTRQKSLQEQRKASLTLQAGKWRKSLNIWRRQKISTERSKSSNSKRDSSTAAPDLNESVQIVRTYTVMGVRKSVYLKTEPEGENQIYSTDDWANRVLQRCRQHAPLPFDQVYTEKSMSKCRKIGEGAFGEVFINQRINDTTVLKIIPIEGDIYVNGEAQKKFEDILPEIIISAELSNLSEIENGMHATSGFVNIKKVTCIRGKYPTHLLKLWDEYDGKKGSENDNPEILPDTQLYIVLEQSFAGEDLEAFTFNNAEQAYFAIQQIVLTLAVGEEAYQFEHRDLHWGNILLQVTKQTNLRYRLQGKLVTLPTKNIKVTIIDYTLSRMTFNNCCLYNDLANEEELFTATGDYQFDIYRMMRDVLKNNWEIFEPKTNVFWISYVIDKMLNGVKYKNTRSKVHSNHMTKMQQLKKNVMNFSSAMECAKHLRKIV